jgi:DNA-binding NtrC family response regulator
MADATRAVTGLATQLRLRDAELRVIAGPDAGAAIQLGDRLTAVIGTHGDADLRLTDDTVSRRHAEVVAVADGWLVRDLDSTNGVRIGGVWLREAVVRGDQPVTFAVGETTLELGPAVEEREHALSPRTSFGRVLGASVEMRRLFAVLERAAPSPSTILLEGESGTGKELLAEAIHRASPRAAGPFVVVDCTTLSPGLIESELFGHEPGAFTGAVRPHAGLFEQAHGGTVFLDEIGELPLALQPVLLRALSERKARRVGGAAYAAFDVRVVAATHRDLERRVREGTFRADLMHRLAVIRTRVPALRHRPGDVGLIARAFVRELRPELDAEAVLAGPVGAAFARYGWPGNVRELRNAIQRLLAVGDLSTAIRGDAAVDADYHEARRRALDRFERAYCEQLLVETGGVVQEAAARAGLSRQMFHRLLKRHDIARRSDE